MTLYYVRKTGSDGAAGTSAGAAWLTVDKAANTVAAGDTVYVGAGVYRELVTMDTAGASGSLITYIGDITGANTGDAGLVIISAHTDDESTAATAGAWAMNGKEFIVVQNISFIGTNSTQVVGDTANAAHIAYEGCKFENCTFTFAGRQSALDVIRIEINNGATPTGNGLQFNQCVFVGQVNLHWDSQATAMVNLKWLFDECLFFANGSSNNGLNMVRQANGGANTIGGVKVVNCSFFGHSIGVNALNFANTTNPCEYYNNAFYWGNTGVTHTATAASGLARGNVGTGMTSSTLVGGAGLTTYVPNNDETAALIGGIHDLLLYRVFGWSPYKPWEPMTLSVGGSYVNPMINRAQIGDVVATADLYNNSRQLGYADKLARVFYFDGSDAGASDPGSAWTSDANAFDNSLSTSATTSTNGSAGSNYLLAEGTNAPSSGGTISTVYARVRGSISGASPSASVQIYTDGLGESLGTITITNTTAAWSAWTALSTPTGGWTWAKVQALEIKAYKNAGTTYTLTMVEISVEAGESALDVGAVESRNRPVRTSGTVNAGTYAAEFDGAGYHDQWMPVDATSTTVTVYARFDSNYNTAVGKPQLIVYNIPGVADQTDTVTASANSWEQLSVNFTPTAAGVVRVRLLSRDASTTGKCFFDDLARS